MMHPLLAMPLALLTLLLLMAALRFYQKRFKPHPEAVRKLLHVGMGLVVLPFPWIFRDRWPVAILAGVAALTLLCIRVVPSLKQGVGKVISGVGRASLGEVYFPISVGILFLAFDSPLHFVIPILILALADAVAAWIGIRYGRLHYESGDRHGEKSTEGSIAFFTVAFFAVHVPLLLFTRTGREETLLIAIILGLLVMLIEAISWQGLDNLLIPLGGFFILDRFLHLSTHQLLLRLGITIGLVLFVLLFRKRSTLTAAGLLGGALFGYGAVTLGGWLWVAPPLILFLTHSAIWPRSVNAIRHDVRTMVAIAGPGLIWLAVRDMTGEPRVLLAYITVFSAHLAIMAASWLPMGRWNVRTLIALPEYIFGGWLLSVLMIPLAWLLATFGGSDDSLLRWPAHFLLTNAAVVAIAAVLFFALLPRLVNRQSGMYEHIHAVGGVLALLASAAMYWISMTW